MADDGIRKQRLSSAKAFALLDSLITSEYEDSDGSDYDPVHCESESEGENVDLGNNDINLAGPSSKRRRLDTSVLCEASTSTSSNSASVSTSMSDVGFHQLEENVNSAAGDNDSGDTSDSDSIRNRNGGSRRETVDSARGEWLPVTNNEGVHMPSFRFRPHKTPGVTVPLDEESTPLDCFHAIFTDQIKHDLISSINEFAKKKVQQNTPAKKHSVYSNWKPLTEYELYKLLAVLIQMGIDPKPRIRDYWDKSDKGYSPWYSTMFDRFQAIVQTMLHVSESPESEGKDKIEPFVNSVLRSFQEAYYPHKELSLDEMVVGWTGRWKYKQYNPNKPHKYHVKVFGLVDSKSKYVLNLLIYFGSETSFSVDLDRVNSQAVKVFEYLLRPFGSGHHVFSDRYYTSMPLLQYLNTRQTYFTGTVNLNRKDFPKELKTLRLPHMGTAWFYSSTDNAICVAFKDKKAKKPVVIVSTNSSVDMYDKMSSRNKTASKPAPVHEYNDHMNGCDVADQNMGYYNVFDRKTYKWWKKLFFWMLEMMQINASVLFKRTHPTMHKCTLLSFKKALICELEEMAASMASPDERSSIRRNNPTSNSLVERFTGNVHIISYAAGDRNCVVCSTPAKRKRTHFFCKGCSNKPYLHPKDCFEQYHTPQSN